MICPKCQKEVSKEEYKKYHSRCKDCWNDYCKTHRYYNSDVQKRAKEKFKLNNPDYKYKRKRKDHVCISCGLIKDSTQFGMYSKMCNTCKLKSNISKSNTTFKELHLIAKNAVKMNDSYNFDDVTDKRPFYFY